MIPKSKVGGHGTPSPSSGWSQRRVTGRHKNGTTPRLSSGASVTTALSPKGVRCLALILAGALLITLINTIFLSSQLDINFGRQKLSFLPKHSTTLLQVPSQVQQPTTQPPTLHSQLHADLLRRARLVIAEHLPLPTITDEDIFLRIKPCSIHDCQTLLQQAPQSTLVYYNPHHKPRYICGYIIEPNGLLIFDHAGTSALPCQYPHRLPTLATLFPILPTPANQRNSSLLPPIQIAFKGVRPSRFDRFYKFRACDVQVEFLPNNLNSLSVVKTIQGTDWEIASSMEYYPTTNDDNDHYYYSTTSLDSDIPLPYFSWDEYAPQKRATVPAVNYDRAIHGAVYLAKNCQSKNGREALVQGLIQFSTQNSSVLRIDSVSKCLHNHDPPPTAIKDDKNEIMSQYLFYLAFENQNAKDYITEKLWGSLFRSGAVPVYVGAPNVQEHVPPHSIINVREFSNLTHLWKYLVQVSQNRTLYESYHAWRQKPLPEFFLQKYNFTHTHSTCRTARWAFAKLYGWGWNHLAQTIEVKDVNRKRRLCWANDDGLLMHPIRERWFTRSFRELDATKDQDMAQCTAYERNGGCGQNDHDSGEDTTCYIPNNQLQNQTQSVLIGSLRRTVWSHDGLVDVWLESTTSEGQGQSIILEMEIPLLMGKSDPKIPLVWKRTSHWEFWVQRGNDRMTILTSQRVIITSPNEGILQMFISVPSDTVDADADRRFGMRLIVEQVEANRRSGKEKSYFGKVSAEDFFQPVQKFLVMSNSSGSLAGRGRDLQEEVAA